MQLLALVGGFHPKMPEKELESLGMEVKESDGRIILGNTQNWHRLKRLGYSHLLLEYLGKFHPDGELPFDASEYIKGKFAGLFKKLGFSGNFEKTREKILDELDQHIEEADLKNPDTTIYFMMKGKNIYTGRLIHEFNPSKFFERKSALRPYSKPISLRPREARCWVNLSGVERGEKLLDPFCGTGGILIEAGLTGCDIYGSDSEMEMVSGTKMNLDYYGLEGKVKRCKAQNLTNRWEESFDGVVTDPPYGRASKVGGEEIESTYKESLSEIERILKGGGKCVLGAPEKISFEEIFNETDTSFEILNKFKERVHGNLQREIFVLKKV